MALAMVYDGSTAPSPPTRRDGQPWSHDRNQPEESLAWVFSVCIPAMMVSHTWKNSIWRRIRSVSALHGAKGVVFRSTPPGSLSDWHTAPRRQYIITLSGEAEIGLGDGTIHRLGPGEVNMAEDLTGHGHTTRVVGQVPRVTATIHMEG